MPDHSHIEAPGRPSAPRRLKLAWYALGLAAIPIAFAVNVVVPQPDGAHAASHVVSALIAAIQLLVLLVVAVLVRRHLAWPARLLLVVPLAGMAVEAFANAQVARTLWDKSWDTDTAGKLGSTLDGFERWHDVVSRGDLIVTIGGAAFVLAVLASRRAGIVSPCVALALCLFPAWALPALGPAMLLSHLAARGSADASRTSVAATTEGVMG